MRNWYNVKAATGGGNALLTVHDDVGAYGVSAKDFLNDLRAADGPEIDVEINSPGGDVFAGLAIFNGLRASGKKVNVKVIGLAASAASLIAMAGDTIEMPENTFMMVHNPWSFAMGGSEDMRATADMLDKVAASLVTTYANRTGKSHDEITALLDAETWMTAQEAVDAGFATSVIPALQLRASFDKARLPTEVRAAFDAAAEPVVEDAAPAVEDAEPVVDAPENTNATPVALAPTFAAQVEEIAVQAGLPQYSALWACDASLATPADVLARATLAAEVNALCALAKMPDMADKLVRGATPLADARAAIFAALASTDQHIDTTPPSPDMQNVGAQPAAVKGADIWAARRMKTKTGV